LRTAPIQSQTILENEITPFVVARKGFLFADIDADAHASANLYLLVRSARANGIDPYRYLTWLLLLPLPQTVDDYAALLP
jgi:transposase